MRSDSVFSRRLLATLLLLGSVGLGSCSCEGGTTEQRPELSWNLEVDPEGYGDYLLDFGLVPVGGQHVMPVTLRNVGNTTLILQVPQPAKPFFRLLADGVVRVEVGGTATIEFGFAPEEESGASEQALITIASNERAEAGERALRLSGRGVSPSLDCEPSPLDFGQVVRGSEVGLPLRCTNPLSIPLGVSLGGLSGNHASAFAVGAEWAEQEVGALASFELPIRFRGEVLGRNEASLSLRGSAGQRLAVVPLVAEAVQHALAVDPATCLDFGFLPVGERRREQLRVRNVGTEELQLEALELGGEGGAHFSVLTELPILLEARGEGVEIEVEFHPQEGGRHDASLALVASGAEPMTACLTGFGGGPQIACEPTLIDFGLTPLGMPRVREIRCVNAGEEPPGSTVEAMYVTALSSEDPAFEVVLRNDDGSVGPRHAGYPIGEGFTLEVRYAPAEERFHEGAILIETLAAPGGVQRIGLAGEGRDLPPCEYTVLPPQIRFGVVDRGAVQRRWLAIRNDGADVCLIDRLELKRGSHPAFSLDPIDHLQLEAGQRLEVEVRFAPTERVGRVEGEITFEITDPSGPLVRIPLSGEAASPCLLVDPRPLDFGIAGLGCHSRTRTLSLRNVCLPNVALRSVESGGGPHDGAFAVISKPLLPRHLDSNEWVDLELRFEPQEIGHVSGTLEVEVQGGGETSIYLVPLEGEGRLELGERTDAFVQRAQRKVDVLWVIDNSGSFAPYQERIAANLPAFLSYAEEQGVDYQIGVTTTGIVPGSGCPGGANGGEDGRLFPVDGSRPRILTPTTPNLAAHWSHNIQVGTCHGLEMAYEAAYRALSSPLIDVEKDPRYRTDWNDGNKGFLRPDASLSIILVTDEAEQSTWTYGRTIGEYIDFYRRVKGIQTSEGFRLHAIAGPAHGDPKPDGCTAEDGSGFRAGVELTGGQFLSICTPTTDHAAWEEALRSMSGAAFSFGTRYHLSSSPAPRAGFGRVSEKDLDVVVNGRKIASDQDGVSAWTYDPVENAISFSPLHVPRPDSDIEVTYQVACLVD